MTPAAGPNIRQGYVTADTTVVTVAETVAATVAGISTDGPAQRIDIRATVALTAGTGTNGFQVRIRRGVDTTGALVGDLVQEAVAAGTLGEATIEVQDVPGDVAGQSYVVTVQQVAATGNGTITSASLEAEILTS